MSLSNRSEESLLDATASSAFSKVVYFRAIREQLRNVLVGRCREKLGDVVVQRVLVLL